MRHLRQAVLLLATAMTQTTRVSSGSCTEVFARSGQANLVCAKS